MRNAYKKILSLILAFTTFFSSVTPALAAISYTYDQNGNMQSDGQTCYTYNQANLLSRIEVCANNQPIAEYLYDHEGKRIVEKEYENGELTHTIYAPDKEFERKKLPGGATEDTKYYFVNDELVARRNNTTTVYYQNDHLGSATLVTNQGGAAVENVSYFPYGDVKSGATAGKFQFTGQEKDPTGLSYYGARYYNSHLQRFTQADTVLPDLYDPQQLNRYSYVRNNPLKYTDPSGHCLWDLCLLELGLAVPILAPPIFFLASHPEIIEIAIGTVLSADASINAFKNEDYINGVLYGGLALLGAKGIKQSLTPQTSLSQTTTINTPPQEKGRIGVNKSIEAAMERGESVVGREVMFKVPTTEGSIRVRSDLVTQSKNGMFRYIESKNGPSAGFTPNQSKALPYIQQGVPITPVGKNAIKAGLIPNKPVILNFTLDRW